MGLFGKMKETMEKIKADMKAKAKIAMEKAKKEKEAKGLTTEEYIAAKKDGTLDSLPIVNPPLPGTDDTPGATTDNTAMYIMGVAIVGLLAWYIIKKKK